MVNRNNSSRFSPGFYTGIVVLFTALTASVFADERALEQRLIDLERRVQQLEAAASATPASHMARSTTPSSLIGRFDEPNSAAKRWIEFKGDGTFVLHTSTEKFAGTWKQSGATVSIRVPAGLDAQFRWNGESVIDSRGVAWRPAKSR
jgi:hypothetical protein